jgi:hypothetical protein
MKRGWAWILVLFSIVNAFTLLFRDWLTAHGIDADVVLSANLLLFVLTLAGYFMYSKAVTTKKGNVMMLNVYGSFMLKFFAVAIAMLVYIFMAKQLNRPGLYIGMALYFLYSFIAIRNVLSLRKRSGNVERKSTV